MYSKRYANEVVAGKRVLNHDELGCLSHYVAATMGAHEATARCLDAMSALASFHRYATEYAVAAQTAFETELEAEDGVGQQGAAGADAEALAEAKQGFEFALERFRNTVARLAVCDPS